MLEFLFDTGETCYYKDKDNNYYALNYNYIDKYLFREYADVTPSHSYKDEDGDICHEYDDDMWDLDSDIIQGYVDDYIKSKGPICENGDLAEDENIFKVIEDDNGWHEELIELLNPSDIPNTFILDKEIFELPNYYKDQTAKFQLYKNCIISDCIRRGYRWEEHHHDLAYKYLNSESIVVEIGSHIGTLTIILSKIAKKVYAFEPLKQSFDILNKNILLNNCENVISNQKGVGEKIGKTKIGFISEGNCGATILKGGSVDKYWDNKTDIDVDLVTLDSLKLDRLDYLKIDVEGYEENVIKGGLKTIKKFKPVIVMECMEDYNLGSMISAETLKIRYKNILDLGYTYKNILYECNWEQGEKIWDILFLPNK